MVWFFSTQIPNIDCSNFIDKMESPRVGQMVAVRAQEGGFWLAKVVGFNGSDEVVSFYLASVFPFIRYLLSQDVQWMDEIKSHHNFFVLLDWYDTISLRAVFKSRVKIDNMKSILNRFPSKC